MQYISVSTGKRIRSFQLNKKALCSLAVFVKVILEGFVQIFVKSLGQIVVKGPIQDLFTAFSEVLAQTQI